ncbi:hypothetical protein ASD30_25390 [Nocardioides sp. Root140]|nr:hypothetical protein ASD30_25390 [Nocardioides sp. Root140]
MALIVLGGVGLTVWQKNRTDRRSLWWSRVQWAADRAAAGDENSQAIGMAALVTLASDKNKDTADVELLGAIVDSQLQGLSPFNPGDGPVVFVVDEG